MLLWGCRYQFEVGRIPMRQIPIDFYRAHDDELLNPSSFVRTMAGRRSFNCVVSLSDVEPRKLIDLQQSPSERDVFSLSDTRWRREKDLLKTDRSATIEAKCHHQINHIVEGGVLRGGRGWETEGL